MNQSRAAGGWQGELHEAIPEITSVYGAGLCRNLPALGVVFLGETSASPGSAEMKATLSWPLSSEAWRQWLGGPPAPHAAQWRWGWVSRDEFPGMSFQLSLAVGIGAAAKNGVTAPGCLATPGAKAPLSMVPPQLCRGCSGGPPGAAQGDRHSPRPRFPQGCYLTLLRQGAQRE